MLVQLTSSGPLTGFNGLDQEVAVLYFLGTAEGVWSLMFDPDPARMLLAASDLRDLRGSNLSFVSGELTVPVHSFPVVEPQQVYGLPQNYPNPLKSEILIHYQLPKK